MGEDFVKVRERFQTLGVSTAPSGPDSPTTCEHTHLTSIHCSTHSHTAPSVRLRPSRAPTELMLSSTLFWPHSGFLCLSPPCQTSSRFLHPPPPGWRRGALPPSCSSPRSLTPSLSHHSLSWAFLFAPSAFSTFLSPLISLFLVLSPSISELLHLALSPDCEYIFPNQTGE